VLVASGLVLVRLVLALALSLAACRAAPTPIPESDDYELTIRDSGRAFGYPVGARFQVVLSRHVHPLERLEVRCTPELTLHRVNPLPPPSPLLWSVRFEAAEPGRCHLENNDFRVTVEVLSGG
jgi:hypothetical protein